MSTSTTYPSYVWTEIKTSFIKSAPRINSKVWRRTKGPKVWPPEHFFVSAVQGDLQGHSHHGLSSFVQKCPWKFEARCFGNMFLIFCGNVWKILMYIDVPSFFALFQDLWCRCCCQFWNCTWKSSVRNLIAMLQEKPQWLATNSLKSWLVSTDHPNNKITNRRLQR